MSDVADRGVGEVLDAARAATGALARDGLVPVDGVDALGVFRELEVSGRQVRAAQIGLVDEVDRRGLYKADGHASAKVMSRHACNLSDAEALRRAKAARALRELPAVKAEFVAGQIGMCQVDRIARVYGNLRVREQLVDAEVHVAVLAARQPYRDFDRQLTDWERLADEDGAGDQAERDHQRRDFRIGRNLNGSGFFTGGVGSVEAAELREIHDHYTEAELEADWAEARDRLGDAATYDDLVRSDAQRRSDAQLQIYRDAAAHCAASPGGSVIVCNVVMDLPTFERHLGRVCRDEPNPNPDPRLATYFADAIDQLDLDADPGSGSDSAEPELIAAEPTATDLAGPHDDGTQDDGAADAEPAGPSPATSTESEPEPHPEPHPEPEPDSDPGPDSDPDTGPESLPATSTEPEPEPEPEPDGAQGVGFRCGTLDGHPLDPAEVAAAALVGRVRRVVVGSDGVVLDMGRLRRLFTGVRQLAVFLSQTSCYWPGCNAPVQWCQADHLDAFNGPRQGRTNPGNGGPACGKHNRIKEQGFTVHRDERGNWDVHRPDGTEIL